MVPCISNKIEEDCSLLGWLLYDKYFAHMHCHGVESKKPMQCLDWLYQCSFLASLTTIHLCTTFDLKQN